MRLLNQLVETKPEERDRDTLCECKCHTERAGGWQQGGTHNLKIQVAQSPDLPDIRRPPRGISNIELCGHPVSGPRATL